MPHCFAKNLYVPVCSFQSLLAMLQLIIARDRIYNFTFLRGSPITTQMCFLRKTLTLWSKSLRDGALWALCLPVVTTIELDQ